MLFANAFELNRTVAFQFLLANTSFECNQPVGLLNGARSSLNAVEFPKQPRP